jgi:hypothetical protein
MYHAQWAIILDDEFLKAYKHGQSSAVMVFGDVFTLVYLPILQTILKSNYSPLQNWHSEGLI